jgi:hypothetical protein
MVSKTDDLPPPPSGGMSGHSTPKAHSPAFPVVAVHNVYSTGLNMRDWFAGTCPHETAAAIASKLPATPGGPETYAARLSRARYIHADAMIAVSQGEETR